MPSSTRCPPRDQWRRLCRGEANPDEIASWAGHLDECPTCRDIVDHVEAPPRGAAPSRTEPDEAVARLIERLKGWVPAPPAAERLGRVGRFRLLRLLGSGGMGAVYLAEDERLARRVAVKVLLARPEADPDLPVRFRREAEAVARLKHPNVVTLFEAGEDDGRPYLVLEYVEGRTLAQRLAEAVLPAREAARLVTTLARAVAAAHALGVVHRDLKPGNVLLAASTPERSEQAKLADFGLAKDAASDADRTRTGAVLGTPSYMAPEQADGAADVGPAADVYGLGAILYECLTGRPPFKGATPLDTLDQVRRLDPVPPRRLRGDVPPEVEVICLRCLAKEPGRRYASAAELADDLGRYLAGEPIRARPAGPTERLVKWARRKPTAAALALAWVAFALLAVLAAGWHYAAVTAALRRETALAERAARQYRDATGTLRRMFGHLETPQAHHVPAVHAAQRAQLETALAFFERAADEQEHPAPETLLDLATFSALAAHRQLHAGETAAAEKNLRRAVATFGPYCREHPDDHAASGLLAASLTYLGAIHAGARRWDEAEAALRRAVALGERLVRDDPADARHKDRLAETYHNLGNLSLARQPPAPDWYEKAAAIRRERLRDEPGNDGHRVALAEHTTNLGLVFAQGRLPEKAVPVLEEAIAALEALAKAHPEIARFGASLGDARVNLGLARLQQGQVEPALAAYTGAAEAYRRVRVREPTYAVDPLPAHGGRAQCLTALKRYAEALPEWDKVVELAPTERRPAYRLSRAVVLARLGEHDRATEEADAVAHGAGSTGPLLYDAACVFALCAVGGERDARAGRAVALLEAARLAGFFDKPEMAAHLKADPDFDSIRGRPEYNDLARRVERPR